MSIEANAGSAAQPEYHRDPTILVQTFVIERLQLDDDLDVAAMKYVDEGYSAKCRELMETDSDVRSLLDQGRLDDAASLLTALLKRWKRTPSDEPSVS